jgi:hypothetical protein
MNDDFCYVAYGLTIRSAIPLPELAPGSGPADVEIVLGDVPRPMGRRAGRNVWGTNDTLFIRPPERFAFWVSGGRRVVVQLQADVDLAMVRPFILGTALGAILHQRSILALHASAVAVDEGCVAFLGAKGAGKSTTAAFLSAQGRAVVADDICAITLPHGQPHVWPNYQPQRLCDDVAQYLGVSGGSTHRAVSCKLAVGVSDAAGNTPMALRAIFVLVDAPVIVAMRLDKVTALHALLTHTFRRRHIIAMSDEQGHLERCAQVVASTPVYSLSRPRELTRLPEVNTEFAECLRQLDAAGSTRR